METYSGLVNAEDEKPLQGEHTILAEHFPRLCKDLLRFNKGSVDVVQRHGPDLADI